VLSDLFNIIGTKNYAYNRQNGELQLFDSMWLVIGARDEGSEKVLRGLTVRVAVDDELSLKPRSFTMMLLNRMSVEGARYYGTTNPDVPFHYVKTDLIDNKALKDSGELETLHFDLDDNPNLPFGYRGYLNRIYPPGSLFHQRFVLGLWVTGEGSIYKDVLSDESLYDDEPWTMSNGKPGLVAPRGLLNAGHERTVSVDCGVDHVQVYLDWVDDGDVCWCAREYWWDSHEEGRQKTDRQYREDLQEFTALHQAQNALILLPPEVASFETECRQAGMWLQTADNTVLDGIKQVAIMLSLGKMKFHRRHVKKTFQQMQAYMWDPKARLRGVEQPLKQKDDGPDAVRYFAKTRIPAWRLSLI